MIERNLSHETIVQNPEYLGEEGAKNLDKLGYDYIDVNYDRFKTVFTPAGAIKSKNKVGVKTVRFVQYRDGTKGIIPQILRYLLNARKTTRLKIKYQGSYQGSWIVDQGSWVKDQGSRILDLGPCSGMNDHPGRDTDVRSRPSESTIKDLSFYKNFIRIQSRIKHLGPCFGTNGHSRRDPDVISRLPDTTIHFLSVFIGFEC